jgi:hypothetical protein
VALTFAAGPGPLARCATQRAPLRGTFAPSDGPGAAKPVMRGPRGGLSGPRYTAHGRGSGGPQLSREAASDDAPRPQALRQRDHVAAVAAMTSAKKMTCRRLCGRRRCQMAWQFASASRPRAGLGIVRQRGGLVGASWRVAPSGYRGTASRHSALLATLPRRLKPRNWPADVHPCANVLSLRTSAALHGRPRKKYTCSMI